jgi:hypothetical protein
LIAAMTIDDTDTITESPRIDGCHAQDALTEQRVQSSESIYGLNMGTNGLLSWHGDDSMPTKNQTINRGSTRTSPTESDYSLWSPSESVNNQFVPRTFPTTLESSWIGSSNEEVPRMSHSSSQKLTLKLTTDVL